MHSCVMIVPAALRDKANALAEVMGWGPDNYSVPLSADGGEPASHYGLHAWVSPEFIAMVMGAVGGIMPDPLTETGYPSEDLAAVMAGLIASTREESTDHFSDICAEIGRAAIIPAITE